MILLADTNVFIKYWRALAESQKDEAAARELETYKRIMTVNEFVTCGVVRAELLHGALRDDPDTDRKLHEGMGIWARSVL